MTEGSSPPVPPLVAAPRASSPGAVRLCSSRSASRSPPADAPRSALVTVTEVPESFERQRWHDASAAVVAGVAAPCSLVAGTQHCEGTEVSAGSFKGMAQLQGQLLEVLDQQSQRLVGVLEATLERRGGDAGVDMGASSEEVWLEEMTIGSDGPWEIARLAKAVEEPAIPTAAPGAPLPMREEMTVGSDGSCEIATPAKAVEEPAVPTAAAAVSSSPAVPTPVPLPTAAPAATGTPLPMPEEMTVWSNGSCEIATPAKAVEEATMPTAAPALSLLPASPAATGAPLSMREEITVGSDGSCEIAEPAKAVEEPTVPMAAPAVSSSPAAPAAAPPPTAAPAATGAPLPMWQDELQGLRAELRETAEEAVASMRHQLQALCEEQRSQLNRESSLVSQVSALKEELHGGSTAVTGTGGAVGTTAGSSTTAHGGNEEEGPLVAELLKRIADLEHTVKVQGEEKAQQAMAYTELNKAVLLDRERRAAQHDRDVVKTQQTLTVQALTLQAELAQTVAREREALDAERKSHACEVAQLRSELEDHRRQAHHHSDGGGGGGGAFGVIGHVDSHKTALAQLRPPPPPPPCQVVLQGGPTCQHQKCLRDEGVAAAAVVAIPPIAPVPGSGSLDLEDTGDNMFHEVLSLADEAVTTNDGSAWKSHQFSGPVTREGSFATEELSTPASTTRSGTPPRPAVIEAPDEAAARWYQDSVASVWKPATACASGPIIYRIDGKDIANAARKVEGLKREFTSGAEARTLSVGHSSRRSGGPGNAMQSRKLGDVDVAVDDEFTDVGEELIRVPARRAVGGPRTLSPPAARQS